MPLDQRPQPGDQFGIGGLDSPTAPTRWRGIAAAGQAHERTGLALAEPPPISVVDDRPPDRGGDYFFRNTSVMPRCFRLNPA